MAGCLEAFWAARQASLIYLAFSPLIWSGHQTTNNDLNLYYAKRRAKHHFFSYLEYSCSFGKFSGSATIHICLRQQDKLQALHTQIRSGTL
jgi:hypothetical protein